MPMSPLIGRRDHLERLEEAWRASGGGRPQLVVMSGPRRVGKTFLLNHFAQGRRHVWHTANGNAETIELDRLATSIVAGLGQSALDTAGGSPARWSGALRLIASHAQEQPLLLVVDEFTTLLTGTPTFAEQLRDVWDGLAMQARHHLMVVLTGSSVSEVERQLAGDAPLFGRATARFRLAPFSYRESAAFHADLGPRELLQAHAACGGFPRNLLSWDPGTSVDDNLLALAGSPGGPLVTEARQVLYDHERRAPGYGRVLRALGHERVAHGRLLGRTGQGIQQVTEVLERAGIIRREVPVGVSLDETKRRLYRIVDPYLRFWFTVLGDEADAVEGGRGQVVLRRSRGRWEQHVAAVFEDECRAHAQRLADAGRWDGPEIGRWWGTPRDPTTGRAEQTEFDVLGLVGGRTTVVGEVKWAAVGDREIHELRHRLRRIADAVATTIALWSAIERPSGSQQADRFFVDDLLA